MVNLENVRKENKEDVVLSCRVPMYVKERLEAERIDFTKFVLEAYRETFEAEQPTAPEPKRTYKQRKFRNKKAFREAILSYANNNDGFVISKMLKEVLGYAGGIEYKRVRRLLYKAGFSKDGKVWTKSGKAAKPEIAKGGRKISFFNKFISENTKKYMKEPYRLSYLEANKRAKMDYAELKVKQSKKAYGAPFPEFNMVKDSYLPVVKQTILNLAKSNNPCLKFYVEGFAFMMELEEWHSFTELFVSHYADIKEWAYVNHKVTLPEKVYIKGVDIFFKYIGGKP